MLNHGWELYDTQFISNMCVRCTHTGGDSQDAQLDYDRAMGDNSVVIGAGSSAGKLERYENDISHSVELT